MDTMESVVIEQTEGTNPEQVTASVGAQPKKRNWILRGYDAARNVYYKVRSTKAGKAFITVGKIGLAGLVLDKAIDYGRRHPYAVQEPEQEVVEPANLPEPETPVEGTEQAEEAVEEKAVEEQI